MTASERQPQMTQIAQMQWCSAEFRGTRRSASVFSVSSVA